MKLMHKGLNCAAAGLVRPREFAFSRPGKTGRGTGWSLSALAAALVLFVLCASAPARTVVVWISIDGFRGDYLDRATGPFFSRLKSEGAVSRHLVPPFPSLTFVSHASQATGVSPASHGIVSNYFFDRFRGESVRMPNDQKWLEAEPIWTTATRQNLGVIVFDWPVSHDQKGQYAARRSGDRYDHKMTDDQRMARLLDAWRTDAQADPPRLMMGYMEATDTPGHKFGPASPEVTKAIADVDRRLESVRQQAIQIFQQKMRAEDDLCLIVTSDHGMKQASTAVDLDVLIGGLLPPGSTIIPGGPVANIYLPETGRAAAIAAVLAALKDKDFIDAYERKDLPARWNFAHHNRSGDLVLAARDGWTFVVNQKVAILPAAEAKVIGVHGWDPAVVKEMHGFLGVWRYRGASFQPAHLNTNSAGGQVGNLPHGADLGEVDGLTMHAIAAGFLGIQKSAEAAPADPKVVAALGINSPGDTPATMPYTAPRMDSMNALAQATNPTTSWLPVVLMIVIGIGFAAVSIIASIIIGPRRTGQVKESTYESGMVPVGDTRRRFNVRFYIVAMIFLVFDVEIVFFYPWAVNFPHAVRTDHPLATVMLASMGVFVLILLIAYLYAWGKGVFKWD